jgi:FMN-dependent oxidoreductase (nitrilotriacetate monooxygenase family)
MGVGHHEAAWRLDRSDPAKVTDVRHFQDLAKIAERGKLDSVFLADGLANWNNVRRGIASVFEPLTLLAAIAAVTEQIGLIATVSTTYNEPFHVARKFASLDHISGGRAGWNIVTSGTEREAQNFNRATLPSHAFRYQRATEFLEVALRLWDSWDADALRFDKAEGLFADADRIREINHVGEEFQVRGPLNVPRSPQGRPLLVQAGSSEDGKDFAARYAEAIFTAQQTLAEGQAFYRDVKSRALALGRDAEQLLILPGIAPVLGSTEAEAQSLAQELEDLISPEYALAQLSNLLNLDASALSLDKPLPELPDETSTQGMQSRYKLVVDLARRDNLTVRQLIGALGGGRGHRVVAGTPQQIADQIELWFTEGAADGFNIMPPHLPAGLSEFVEHVVPILQRRGLFRTEYTGSNLRENYGLPPVAPLDEKAAEGSTWLPSARVVARPA